ncbi:MAG: deoxynucleoside kinase [candidate division Zixibacteria bacterium]|nr:deoxynucleoside kinase [candidate division Zixibacteria bacterium]
MDDRFSHLRHIAVDGPIGVGKTTFCRLLADRIDAHLVLEQVDGNPFLDDFYKNRQRHAFQTQIFFLLSRYTQQRDLIEYDLFMKRIVSDYTFEKDLLFATVNLTEAELAIYRQVAALLQKELAKPDLVVFLTASVDVLMARIKKRNLSREKNLDADYLTQIVEAYNYHFFHYNATPLLVIKTDQLNFVEKEEYLQELFDQIADMRQGTRYFTVEDGLLGK